MERSEILAAMGGLKLFGMQAADDEIVATAVKRQHEPHRIIGDLLAAELSEKQARSMKYRLTVARLPFAKEIDEFAFTDTPVNETLVRELAASPTAPRRPRPRPPPPHPQGSLLQADPGSHSVPIDMWRRRGWGSR
jgi:hypothetical protein